ncbi:MAG: hypothetical protein ABI378_02755 [Chitinophagaceae bacterium]
MSALRFISFVLLTCCPLSGFGFSDYTIAAHILPSLNIASRVSDDLPFIVTRPVFSIGYNLEIAKKIKRYKVRLGVGVSGFGSKIVAKKTYGYDNLRIVSQSISSHFLSVNLNGQRELIKMRNFDFAGFIGVSAAYIVNRSSNFGTNGSSLLNITHSSASTNEGIHIAPVAGIAMCRQFKKLYLESRLGYSLGLQQLTKDEYIVRESGISYPITTTNYGSSFFLSIGIGFRL